MPAPCRPSLTPGRIYRTRDLERWGTNAPRLAKRLLRQGTLEPLAHGLFLHPRRGRFGTVPPSDEELMRAFLDGGPFVLTGPDRWNTLDLGATAVFPLSLVYNTKRSGSFRIGGRPYLLRRVRFPRIITAEWYVVDLIENADRVGLARAQIERALAEALARRRFDPQTLRSAADEYGTHQTRELVERALMQREE